MMWKIFSSWLALAGAGATLLLLPNVSVNNWSTLVIFTTLLWLLQLLIWPILKIFLLPFNLATMGAIGPIVYSFLFWICLWIYPGFTITPLAFFGGSPQPALTIFIFSIALAILDRIYVRILTGK